MIIPPPIPCHPLDRYRFVYVEVPKSGCTSVKHALCKAHLGTAWESDDFEELHSKFGYTDIENVVSLQEQFATTWKDYFKFTLVRCPIARFESLFYEKIRHPAGINTFIIEHLTPDNSWLSNAHGTPQVNLIGADLEHYDYVSRTESMAEVGQVLSNLFGPLTLRQLNQSAQQADREPLSNEAILRLSRIYHQDFCLLGYDIPASG